jgi:hypothetical protein
VLAAAVVLLVVAATVTFLRLNHSDTAPANPPVRTVSPVTPSATSTPGACGASPRPAGAPRYFVTLGSTSDPCVGAASDQADSLQLAVHDTWTDRITATLPGSADTSAVAIAATPDPLTFYTLVEDQPTTPGATMAVFALRLTSSGAITSYQPLDGVRVPYTGWLPPLAVSADGRQLAVRVSFVPARLGPNGKVLAYPVQGIEILSLADGRVVRTFQNTMAGYVTNVTWAADGHRLAFQLDNPGYSVRPYPPNPPTAQAGIWVLDTRSATTLLGQATQVVTGQRVVDQGYSMPVLSPDGSHLYVLSWPLPHPDNVAVPGEVLEIEVGSARPPRVVASAASADWSSPPFLQLAIDPSGHELLVGGKAAVSFCRIDIATGRTLGAALRPQIGGLEQDFAW